MAQTTVPVLPAPRFPQQAYDGGMLFALDRLVARTLARTELSACSYQSPESSAGACDGGLSCPETATVFALADEQEYCLGHFEEVAGR